jgi:hypothetical protein
VLLKDAAFQLCTDLSAAHHELLLDFGEGVTVGHPAEAAHGALAKR